MAGVAIPVLAQDNLMKSSDFAGVAEAGGLPSGWIKGSAGLVTVETEGGATFLRLVSEQPDQLVEVSQEVLIPAEIKGLDYTASFRTAGVKFGKSFVNDARTRFQFLDAEGKAVKPSPGDAVFTSHAKTWTEVKRSFLVPAGACKLRLVLCLNKPASGTLDVRQVTLTAMNSEAAEALMQAPILAAKKKTDDEAEAKRMLTLSARTPEIKVSGSRLVTVHGDQPVLLQGVNIPSLEWSAKGENIRQSVKVALIDWKANVIRLPIHPSFWFGRGKPPQSTSNDADAYRKIVDEVVTMAAGQGAYVILDCHRYHAPKDLDLEFWKDAAVRYKNNPAVLFDILNEPGGISWEQWRNGGLITEKLKKGETVPVSYQSPGMQGLVNAIREAGAKNIVVVGGLSNAYDLTGVLEGFALSDDSGYGIMYATHFYNWHGGWEKRFLPVAERYPILVGEFGADIKKMPFVAASKQEDPMTWIPDALAMIQKYKLNWTAFSLHPKSTPVLIKDWGYEPSPFFGDFVKRALAGEQFELKKMR